MNLSIFSFKTILKYIYSYISIIGLLILVTETGLYLANSMNLLNYLGPSYNSELISPKSMYVDIDPNYGMWRIPNYEARITGPCFDATYYTNFIGARDDSWDDDKNFKTSAVVLGDSYLEGYGVNEEERSTEIFENLSRIKMKNLAISGHFGPTQYRLLYEQIKDKISHDFIFLGLNLPSDLYDEDYENWINRSRYRPYLIGEYPNYKLEYHTVPLNKSVYGKNKTLSSTIKNILNEYSQIYHLVIRISFNIELNEYDLNLKHTKDKFSFEENQLNLDRIRYNIEQLDTLSGNKKIFIFSIPNKTHLNNTEDFGFQYLKRHLSNSRDLMFWDISSKNISDNMFFQCDIHWNEFGNKVIGKRLFEEYSKNFNVNTN
jgi:hypothetical protein